MAENIISPGVFTRENDLTFLPQGIGQIGAAIIGPTVDGPAFTPTVVRSFADYERIFGSLHESTFIPQTVREYLRNAGSVTVCRVLAGGGYTYTNGTSEGYVAIIATDDTNSTLLGVIGASKYEGTPDLSATTSSRASGELPLLSGSPTIFLSGSTFANVAGADADSTLISASFNPTSNQYWAKTLGYDPHNSKDGVVSYTGVPGYTYIEFKNVANDIIGTGSGHYPTGGDGLGSGSKAYVVTMSANIAYDGGLGQTEGYSYASTPYVTSQYVAGAYPNKTTKQLFKFHTLAHGTPCNRKYKISIANLKEPSDIDGIEQYSNFSVIIRKYSDKDKNPVIFEQFNNCNLNPDSPRYISRVIGDRYPQYNDTLDKVELLGNYPNISKYVRVEVTQPVEGGSLSPKLSPKGFSAVTNPIPMASFEDNLAPNLRFPSASYEEVQQTGTDNTYSIKGFLGWKFNDKDSDNENFILPISATTQETNLSGDFNVEDFFGHASSSLWSGSLSQSIDSKGETGPAASQLKFSIPFQGGDDGIAPYQVKFTGAESSLASSYTGGTNLYGFDLSATDKAGYKGYKKAIDILGNQDEYDINMLVLPGVIHSLHPLVTNKGIDVCEERGDAFYVMDLSQADASVNTAVSNADGLDTNYAAVYYPWVKVLDTAKNKPVLVPPSVIVPSAIAQSDQIAAEWFAPAGLNRGVLGNVIEAKIRLNQRERDTLYDNKINPIATFPQTGVCIWGQKTLQERSTALDRINVRRLLIALKKFIASSSKYLVFEQNTIQTRNRFLNIVNPYLESVQQRQGLYAFRVQMDEGNNTPEVIDRNQLVGAIYLQPTRTAEFIILDFNVMPTGATFDNGGGGGAY